MNDLRFALRRLLKNPGFTAVAVLTLAIFIGANLTIFAVIDSVLLRPLPFPEPDRLVTMFNSYPKMGQDRADSSFPNYYNRRGNIAAFSHVAAFRDTTAVVGEAGSTELTDLLRVSPEFFDALLRIRRPHTVHQTSLPSAWAWFPDRFRWSFAPFYRAPARVPAK
jgi:hypothetical protein